MAIVISMHTEVVGEGGDEEGEDVQLVEVLQCVGQATEQVAEVEHTERVLPVVERVQSHLLPHHHHERLQRLFVRRVE